MFLFLRYYSYLRLTHFFQGGRRHPKTESVDGRLSGGLVFVIT